LPDGKQIWVANAGEGTVSILDVSRKDITQTLAAEVAGANRLKFIFNGKLVLISTLRRPNLTVITATLRKTIKPTELGRVQRVILMQPDGSRAFVACTPDDYVDVIDLHSLDVVGRVETGGGPDGLA
jgi:YVTN family beta-propeller protein